MSTFQSKAGFGGQELLDAKLYLPQCGFVMTIVRLLAHDRVITSLTQPKVDFMLWVDGTCDGLVQREQNTKNPFWGPKIFRVPLARGLVTALQIVISFYLAISPNQKS